MGRWGDKTGFEALVTQQQFPTAPVKATKHQVITAYKSNVRGWRTINGQKKYYKSLWEINFAHYLEFLKSKGAIKDWVYEPRIFAFPKEAYRSGPFYYCPDFRIEYSDGRHSWQEVKGYMNKASKQKTKRFKEHFPNEELYIVGAAEMKQIREYRDLIPNWESLPSR